MTALSRAALMLAASLTLASLARAGDDCCFDWNNTSAGVGDAGGGSVMLNAGPPRPGAPFGWALCTGATENGTGQTSCFSRLNRQAFVPGHSCALGTPDPNGVAPLPNTPFGSGFKCVTRADQDTGDISLQFINMITEPPGQQGQVVFEDALPVVSASVPSLGRWGSWVLAALLGLGGALMLRRSGSAQSSV